jgi:predicted dehydrogenase
MAKKIRYGLIGYGIFAERRIAPAIKTSLNSEVWGIQKRSLAEAKEKARQAGIPLAFDSVQKLVEHPDIDAVFICSANAAHYPETIAAARAGKHVIVEKPAALTVAQTRDMIDTCASAGVKFMVAHMVRLSPVVQKIKSFVASGAYGPVIFARADFAYDRKFSHRGWLIDPAVAGGGPLFDIGVHCLDTLRFILDDEVDSVKAHMQPPPDASTTELTAHLSLRFARGTPASIFCSYEVPSLSRFLEVLCRNAAFRVSGFTAVNETLRLTTVLKRDDADPLETSEEIVVPDLYEKEVSLFSDAIINNTAPPLSGENALRDMIVLEEAMVQGRR